MRVEKNFLKIQDYFCHSYEWLWIKYMFGGTKNTKADQH